MTSEEITAWVAELDLERLRLVAPIIAAGIAALEAGAKAGAALDASLMWDGEQFTLVIGAKAPGEEPA